MGLAGRDFKVQPGSFSALRDKILDQRGSLKEKYLGMKGYALLAKQHFDGDMQKAFINVSAVLDKGKFKELSWQGFQGSVSEFSALRDKILNQKGSLKEQYLGMEGYALFAENHFDGTMMKKAFVNVSAVLDKGKFKELGWQGFQGSVSEFSALRDKILDQRGNLRKEHFGMEAYALFAKQHFDGAMQKAFLNVSAVLDKGKFKELGWQVYLGSVSEFSTLRDNILDQKGNLREQYLGMKGYALFAEQYFSGDMRKAFVNVSAVLDKGKFKELGWQVYLGSVSEFSALRDKILDQRGNLRKEHFGMEAYALFAEKHFDGTMSKAFVNVSAGLDKRKFKELGWQKFQGSVLEFSALRNKILDQKGNLREQYLGMEGYALFAEKHFDGTMSKAFVNVSAVLGGPSEMKELGFGMENFSRKR